MTGRGQGIEIFAVIILAVMFVAIILIVLFATTKSRREYKCINNLFESEGLVTGIQYIDVPLNREGQKITVYYDYTNCTVYYCVFH